MRPPVHDIAAPPFPAHLKWINSRAAAHGQQLGGPVLIEFWDFCRPNSIRTLPYLREWHARYAPAGLQVIGVHTAGFEPSRDPEARRGRNAPAERRLPGRRRRGRRDLEPVRQSRAGPPATCSTSRGCCLTITTARAPTRRPSGRSSRCSRSISRLIPPKRPEDVRARGWPFRATTSRVPTPVPTRPARSGRCSTAGARCTPTAACRDLEHPGCYELISHPRSTQGELELEIGEGVRCSRRLLHSGLAQ